jgi:YaaC-like protein
LSFYCDVEDTGKKFVQDLTGFVGAQCDDTFGLFQAFIRQGQTFFSSARHLEHRASPLFFYYAFLNLAKAYIALRKPDLFGSPLKHGLSHRYKAQDDFNSQVVAVAERGVFPELYELLTEEQLPKSCSFRVVDLLGYLSDISFEYQVAGFGTPFLLPVRSKLFVSQKSETVSEVWPVFAVAPHEKLVGRSYALTALLNAFEEVSLGKTECERIFNLKASVRLQYRFFQSKNIYHIDADRNEFPKLREDSRAALKLLFMPNVFADEEDFHFALPTSDKPTLKLDEFIAGYLIFFYLGSLVRYRPDYLERILRSREAWIIRRFTTSCATTLLRHASTFLLGQNRVFHSR